MLLLLGLKGNPLILLIWAASLHLGAFKKSLLHVIVASLCQFFHVMIKLLAKEDPFPQFIKMIGSLNAELGRIEMWPTDLLFKVIAKSCMKYL